MRQSEVLTQLNMRAFVAPIPYGRVLAGMCKSRDWAWLIGLVFGVGIGAFLVDGMLTALRNNEMGDLALNAGVFLVFIMIPLVRISNRKFRRLERAERLRTFAADNGFSYNDMIETVQGPGLILQRGEGQSNRIDNVVGGTFHDVPFLFGNFFYLAHKATLSEVSYGIIQIKLPRHLPHILLDAKKNNFAGMNNISRVQRSQQFDLEGDFYKYFTLYVPKGYERDALYFITPELMQLLITYGAKYDIEISGNHLLIYNKHPFQTQRTETIEFIFRVIAILGGEMAENTARYADERVGDRNIDAVAPQGEHLRYTAWLTIILSLIFLLSIIF